MTRVSPTSSRPRYVPSRRSDPSTREVPSHSTPMPSSELSPFWPFLWLILSSPPAGSSRSSKVRRGVDGFSAFPHLVMEVRGGGASAVPAVGDRLAARDARVPLGEDHGVMGVHRLDAARVVQDHEVAVHRV